MDNFLKRLIIGVILWGCSLTPEILKAKKQVPTIETLGILPVQWIGMEDDDFLRFAQFKENIVEANSLTLLESSRFRVIHSQLVENLWETPIGRQELKEEFELDAFYSLYVAKRPDHFVLESRLLSADFKILVVEQMILGLRDARNSDFGGLKEKVGALNFKMLNRLPLDVYVNSVQGQFITLSGGVDQGIHQGDKMPVFRSYISSTHPAHGGWENFSYEKVGAVKVIDSQSTSSVAQILSEVTSGAIQIGDGSKVERIAGRSYYSALENQIKPDKVVETDSILLPSQNFNQPKKPKTLKPGTMQPKSAPIAQLQASQSTPMTMQEDLPQSPAPENDILPPQPKKAPVQAPPPQTPLGSGSEDELFGMQQPLQSYLSSLADQLTIFAGQTTWNYSGPGSTGSKLEWYLPVNYVNVRLVRNLAKNLKYGVGGGIQFGKTKNSGAYFGYDGHIRAFWESPLSLPTINLKLVQAGANGRFTGLGVSHEKYGGGDVVMGGVFGALIGDVALGSNPFEWRGEYSITPLTIGRIGYGGQRRVIRSSLGWEFIAQLLQGEKPGGQSIRWGGSLAIGNHSVLDNASEETSKAHVTISGVARMNL